MSETKRQQTPAADLVHTPGEPLHQPNQWPKTFQCALCKREGLNLKRDLAYTVNVSRAGTSHICNRCSAWSKCSWCGDFFKVLYETADYRRGEVQCPQCVNDQFVNKLGAIV